MTSRALFSNLMKNELKRRIYAIVITALFMLLSGPVALLLWYETIDETMPIQNINSFINERAFALNGMDWVMLLLYATLLGFAGFSYLFSKKQVDLYHSIPLKREKLFFINYLLGFFIFTVCYLLQFILTFLVVLSKGFFSPKDFPMIFTAFIIKLVYFLFFYHVVILAIMLTGRRMVAVAAELTFVFWQALVSFTCNNMMTTCFKTFYSNQFIEKKFLQSFICGLSPVLSFLDMTNLVNCIRENEKVASHLIILGTSILLTVLLLVLDVKLYQKRASEKAESSLAFKKIDPFVRFFIVIPMAVLGGIGITEINNKPDSNWFWFGLILSAILLHMVLEIIFNMDMKACFKHKVQLLSCIVITCVIAAIFKFDLMGYDRYLPELDKIESAAVSFGNIDSDINSYKEIKIDEAGLVSTRYADREEVLLENYYGDPAAVLELAKIGRDHIGDREEFEAGEYKPRQYGVYEKASVQELQDTLIYYVVRFRMKNGNDVIRSYGVYTNAVKQAVAKVYDTPEYKEAAYPLLNLDNIFCRIEANDIFGTKVLSVTNQESMKELLEIYKKEFKKLTIADLEKNPIGSFNPFIKETEYTEVLTGYYIYESFTETIAKMKELGADVSYMTNKIPMDGLLKVSVGAYGYIYDELGMDNYDYEEIIYSADNKEDMALIESLKDNFVCDLYSWSNQSLHPYYDQINYTLYYESKDGFDRTICAYLKNKDIPQKLKDDIMSHCHEY